MEKLTPEPGAGGLPRLTLHTPAGAHAEIYLHGAHITHWHPAPSATPGTGGTSERLFLSRRAEFRPAAAIRGGMPVIFPQFAAEGPLPRHGFARTAAWEVTAASSTAASLRLRDTDLTRRMWPHAFQADLSLSLSDTRLEATLRVTNTGTQAFTFTCALHTYLAVADIAQVSLEGLRGVRYRDQANGNREGMESEPALRFAGEVDRIYLGAPARLRLREAGRSLALLAEGFPDVVVWNPGPLKGAALSDLEPDGYRRFVCVEAAAVGTPVALGPGADWRGAQSLSVE